MNPVSIKQKDQEYILALYQLELAQFKYGPKIYLLFHYTARMCDRLSQLIMI